MNGDRSEISNVSNDNFWVKGDYHKTIDRINNAHKLTSGLLLMIEERAIIENAYAENLKKWSTKWTKGSRLEYGSAIEPWKGLCKEALEISEIHQRIKNCLMDDVYSELHQWKNEEFHKTPIISQSLKEAKQIEQDFEAAQKPWNKLMKKVSSSKKEYHQACKLERSLLVHLQNARNDPSGSTDQIKKAEDRLKKAEKDIEQSRDSYKSALEALSDDRDRYTNRMSETFDRTQEMERKRFLCFKTIFNRIHSSLDVSKADFHDVYNELENSINNTDFDADLESWSKSYGVDMPLHIAQFQEYSPELSNLSKKRSSEYQAAPTLTGITPLEQQQRPSSVVIASDPASIKSSSNAIANSTNGSSDGSRLKSPPNPFDEESGGSDTAISPTEDEAKNPFEVALASDEAAIDALYDDGRPGTRVRALYKYDGVETDELTFQAGDVFEKLDEADDQGWCKGRKDNRVGLYPANYAEDV